jgi:hypothetical protein
VCACELLLDLISAIHIPLQFNLVWYYDFMQQLLVLMLACVKQKKSPSLASLLDHTIIGFLDHLFLLHYLKIGTSPKPHLHLFNNSEAW